MEISFQTDMDNESLILMQFIFFCRKIRFVDVAQGRKLHLWRGESTESGFASLVSAICTCGSDNAQASGASGSPSWIASGLSSGQVRLFDVRSGNIIASWKAHDGYVTKVCKSIECKLLSQN